MDVRIATQPTHLTPAANASHGMTPKHLDQVPTDTEPYMLPLTKDTPLQQAASVNDRQVAAAGKDSTFVSTLTRVPTFVTSYYPTVSTAKRHTVDLVKNVSLLLVRVLCAPSSRGE